MLTRFDHVTIAVRDPAHAIAQYEQLLGVAPTWRGEHPELGLRAALFGLENGLIELVGPADEHAPEAEGLRGWLASHGEGLQALALGTEDAEAASAALRARGVRATAPQDGEAQGADGVRRRYRTVELSPRATRGTSVLLVERADADALQRRHVAAQAVSALDHVVIRTSDVAAARALYGEALALRLALERELGGRRMLFFRFGGVTLEIVEDTQAGQTDALYGLAYRVRDLESARARLLDSFDVSEPRAGQKPGTRVFTVRSGTLGVPTLFLHDPSRS